MAANVPRTSVITGVHDGERYLAEAIESVLAQTCGDFEYILVDDGSADDSPAILDRYARLDVRLRSLQNPTRLGISRTLNRALACARGSYVAILDQDDLWHPQRLALQVAFLDTNPDVGVVGAQAEAITADGRSLLTKAYPTSAGMSRWVIMFGTPVLHSAAMVRRVLLERVGNYAASWRYAADYCLWAALLDHTAITNLPDILVSYRRHDRQTSILRSKAQEGEVWLLIHRLLAERLGLRASLEDIGALFHGVRGAQLTEAGLPRAAALLDTIHERYLLAEQPDPATLGEIEADCARRLLIMAWVHRHTQRAASRELLRRALLFDPQLWQRPKTRALLRQYGMQQQPGPGAG